MENMKCIENNIDELNWYLENKGKGLWMKFNGLWNLTKNPAFNDLDVDYIINDKWHKIRIAFKDGVDIEEFAGQLGSKSWRIIYSDRAGVVLSKVERFNRTDFRVKQATAEWHEGFNFKDNEPMCLVWDQNESGGSFQKVIEYDHDTGNARGFPFVTNTQRYRNARLMVPDDLYTPPKPTAEFLLIRSIIIYLSETCEDEVFLVEESDSVVRYSISGCCYNVGFNTKRYIGTLFSMLKKSSQTLYDSAIGFFIDNYLDNCPPQNE